MTILEIYEKYKILPQLQLHMLRVAAVSSIICDNFQKDINKKNVLTASLLHDMGNIIKFQLDPGPFPSSIYEPEGKEYWKKVKKEFFEKYGNDEHRATIEIVQELKVNDKVLELIDSVGFSKAQKNYEYDSFAIKICAYSDMRVLPHKISTLKERLSDLKKRYKHRMGPERLATFDGTAIYFYKIEEQIFKYCSVQPDEITEKKAKPIVEKLKSFEI